MSRNPVSAKPLSHALRSSGHKVREDMILALVKPKASAASTRPLPDSRRRHPTGGTVRSLLLMTIPGGTAIAVAVFGRPTQALAAAVIVVAMCALTQGRSVTRSTASVVHSLLRALQGTNAEASAWPTRPGGTCSVTDLIGVGCRTSCQPDKTRGSGRAVAPAGPINHPAS
jgi:hypothetical protein